MASLLDELNQLRPETDFERIQRQYGDGTVREPDIGGGLGGEYKPIQDTAYGIAETGAALGTGLLSGLSQIPGGLLAGGDAVIRKLRGEDDPLVDAREFVDLTTTPVYQPKTRYGRKITENIGAPFNWVGDKLRGVADWTQDKQLEGMAQESPWETDYEAEDTALLPSLIAAAPEMVGIFNPLKNAPKALSDTVNVRGQAKDMGLDVRAPYDVNAQNIQNAADSNFQAGNPPSQGMVDVAQSVSRADKEGRATGGALFDEAKEAGAEISTDHASKLVSKMNQISDQFLGLGPSSIELLTDFRRLSRKEYPNTIMGGSRLDQPNIATMDVQELMGLRQKINRSLPASNDQNYKAMAQMRDALDEFMDNSLIDDLVQGDASAISKWKKANDYWKGHRGVFDSNRILTQLRNMDTDATGIKKLLFGTNAVGAHSLGLSTVQSLKKILGKDSPQFQAVKSSVLSDVMMPLFNDTPDLMAFAENFRKFKRGNPDMARELFGAETMNDLDFFANYARQSGKEMPPSVLEDINIARAASVSLLGNQLAKSALQVSAGERLARFLQPDKGTGRMNRLVNNIAGYDTRAKMFPKTSVLFPSAIEGFRNTQEENRKMNDQSSVQFVQSLLGMGEQ